MGIRISEMEEATTFGADDYVPIVTNGTNKKALGAKIKNFIAGFFVSKSGDTMTGNLTINKANGQLISKNPNFTINTSADNGVSSTQIEGVIVNDSADYTASRFISIENTNGNVSAQMACFNKKTDGTEVNNYINTTVKKDGTREYSVADPVAFRNAIEISAANTPFDNTGTGLSSNNVQSAIEVVNEKANTALQISNGSITVPWGNTASITRVAQFKSMLIIGGRLNKGFMVFIPSGTNEYVILSNVDSCITGVSVSTSAINIAISSSGYGSNIVINTIVLI